MLCVSERISSASGHSTYLPSTCCSWNIKTDKNKITTNVNITLTVNDCQSKQGFTHPNDWICFEQPLFYWDDVNMCLGGYEQTLNNEFLLF